MIVKATTIEVDAAALRQVLSALIGPDHYIRELQATRSLPGSPINTLVEQYNDWASAQGDLQ